MTLRLKIALFVAIFILGFVAHYLWGDNNIVEEITEELIKQQYGIDVEFSRGK